MLEVLVAAAVLTMMVTSVWTSFKGTVNGMKLTETLQMRYGAVRGGLNRMVSEISMAYLSMNRPLDETRHFTMFEGRDEFGSDSLTFSAFAHLRLRKDADEGDQSVIQFFVASDPKDSRRKHLYRRETRRLTGDLPEALQRYFPAYVLIEDIESLDFKYWDDRKNEFVEEWRTTKQDMQPDRLPQRVKIKLGLKDENGEVVYYTTQATTAIRERIDLSKTK